MLLNEPLLSDGLIISKQKKKKKTSAAQQKHGGVAFIFEILASAFSPRKRSLNR